MSRSGDLLGVLSLLLALATAGVWAQRAYVVRMPENRTAFVLAFALALVLGIASFAVGNGAAAGVAAGIGIGVSALMLLLRASSAQDAKVPAVAVGGPIIDFSAPDEDGRVFDLASLRGRPYLLKFFRGHW